MPIYEYQCPACGHAFERLIRTADDTPDRCPACVRGKPRKMWSAFSVAAPMPAPTSGCGTCPRESVCPMSGGGCPSLA